MMVPPGGKTVISEASSKPPGTGTEVPAYSCIAANLTGIYFPLLLLGPKLPRSTPILEILLHSGFYFSRIQSLCVSVQVGIEAEIIEFYSVSTQLQSLVIELILKEFVSLRLEG